MTFRRRHYLRRRFVLGLALAALAAPLAQAQPPTVDLTQFTESGRAKAAAVKAESWMGVHNGQLGPSTRQVQIPSSLAGRDFGPAQLTGESPVSTPVTAPAGEGFDWPAAVAGFGVALGLALLGGAMALNQRGRGKLATGH